MKFMLEYLKPLFLFIKISVRKQLEIVRNVSYGLDIFSNF